MASAATGFAVGMNLPDDKLPLIKTMKVDYVKRSQGDMKAVALVPGGPVVDLYAGVGLFGLSLAVGGQSFSFGPETVMANAERELVNRFTIDRLVRILNRLDRQVQVAVSLRPHRHHGREPSAA